MERLLHFYEQALLMKLPCLLLNGTKKLLLHLVGTYHFVKCENTRLFTMKNINGRYCPNRNFFN